MLSLIKGNKRVTQYADIGSGDLYFTERLKAYTDRPVYAIDVNYEANESADDSIIRLKNFSGIAHASIDYIFLMDVLEHVNDEEQLLNSARNILKDNGRIAVTVPAYQFLFGGHDIFLKHFRRYNFYKLKQVLEKCDFDVKEYFYFYVSPLIIRCVDILIARNSRKKMHGAAGWKFSERSMITIAAQNILSLEFMLARFFRKLGIILPGLSLCAICQKRSA